jgi:hypothetical protein
MSYPINYPTPQNANVQIFNCNTDATVQVSHQSWVKPQGANMVWFTLIGAGGQGGGTDGIQNWSGGGSGAVTNLMIPAFLIPDILYVWVGNGGFGAAPGADGNNGAQTVVQLIQGGGNLLTANGGNGGTNSSGAGGPTMNANYFTAAGFFQSTAGSVGSVSASPTGVTFLSGGGVASAQTANYGYSNGRAAGDGGVGYFQMSPIIVGVGGNGSAGGSGAGSYKGGIGCGGGGSSSTTSLPYAGNPGGDGLAIIITW